jgi:hypothetical protein
MKKILFVFLSFFLLLIATSSIQAEDLLKVKKIGSIVVQSGKSTYEYEKSSLTDVSISGSGTSSENIIITVKSAVSANGTSKNVAIDEEGKWETKIDFVAGKNTLSVANQDETEELTYIVNASVIKAATPAPTKTIAPETTKGGVKTGDSTTPVTGSVETTLAFALVGVMSLFIGVVFFKKD